MNLLPTRNMIKDVISMAKHECNATISDTQANWIATKILSTANERD